MFTEVYRRVGIVIGIIVLSTPSVLATPRALLASDQLDRYVAHYDLITLDAADLKRRALASGRISIAAGLDRFDIQLEPVDLRAPGFRAQITNPDGSVTVLPDAPISTFRGRVLNRPDAEARFSITDRGVGMSDSRVAELNRILERPPALGLSVEPTLGLYVVAKLAHRHGLRVQLVRSVPGITAKVTIPRDRLESVAVAEPSAADFEVIDLTRPEMLEPVGSEAPGTGEAIADLPVRVPGEAFHDEEPASSVAVGESGSSLRSALIDYHRGRAEADEAGGADV